MQSNKKLKIIFETIDDTIPNNNSMISRFKRELTVNNTTSRTEECYSIFTFMYGYLRALGYDDEMLFDIVNTALEDIENYLAMNLSEYEDDDDDELCEREFPTVERKPIKNEIKGNFDFFKKELMEKESFQKSLFEMFMNSMRDNN